LDRHKRANEIVRQHRVRLLRNIRSRRDGYFAVVNGLNQFRNAVVKNLSGAPNRTLSDIQDIGNSFLSWSGQLAAPWRR